MSGRRLPWKLTVEGVQCDTSVTKVYILFPFEEIIWSGEVLKWEGLADLTIAKSNDTLDGSDGDIATPSSPTRQRFDKLRIGSISSQKFDFSSVDVDINDIQIVNLSSDSGSHTDGSDHGEELTNANPSGKRKRFEVEVNSSVDGDGSVAEKVNVVKIVDSSSGGAKSFNVNGRPITMVDSSIHNGVVAYAMMQGSLFPPDREVVEKLDFRAANLGML
ncbi:hypothetical protein FRX31_007422 [Thalictrum thalictroides]|uniref:Uncharacterized protein n=1 Tax=Thalictrum thalictroides TaxID=46969 RepID=A0A7J6WZU5_THATH|nr:hypothetical protein FRX31_007422 [Thalictrum thalictroides]